MALQGLWLSQAPNARQRPSEAQMLENKASRSKASTNHRLDG
jgi:hypothetical protein